MTTRDIWVAEYSPSQKAFHRQELRDAVLSNARRLLKQDISDWIIFYYGTQKECGVAIATLRDKILGKT